MPEDYVIVAEPDWNLRNVLRQHLDMLGYRVLVTPIAAEAEDFASWMIARLVILDAELPGFDGFEACARIRRKPGYEAVPIVLLTATMSPRRKAAAQRAGASVMLIKPFSVNDLMREVEPFLFDPDTMPPRAEPEPRIAGMAESSVRVWDAPPPLAWKYGEGSELAAGKRTLEMMRLTGRKFA